MARLAEDKRSGDSIGSGDIKMDVDSFVKWINSFDSLSHECTDVTDLSSGIILFEVLAEIDPTRFKLIKSADVGDNWVLKFNNLKKLYNLMESYYVNALGKDFKKIHAIDLNRIAKDSDISETLKLCKLVLGIAVFCENNKPYIEKIQKLPAETQQTLMIGIIDIDKVTSNPDQLEPDSPSEQDPLGTNYAPYSAHSEYSQAGYPPSASDYEAIKKLEADHEQLIKENSELQRHFDILEMEIDDLNMRLRNMEQAMAQANETGKSDYVMRAEIDFLKRKLTRSEDNLLEMESAFDQRRYSIERLTRKVTDLEKKAAEVPVLLEKLRECDCALEKLQKTENIMEKYREKVSACRWLHSQVKESEERHRELLEEKEQIRKELDHVLQFKNEIQSYKDEVSNLENTSSQNQRTLLKLENERGPWRRKCEAVTIDNQRYMDRIEALRDSLNALSTGEVTQSKSARRGNPSSSLDNHEHDDIMFMDDDDQSDDMDSMQNEANVVELKREKRRLERQIKTLQEQTANRSQETTVLKPLLEDTNRLKEQCEKNYLAVSLERDILQGDLQRIRDSIPEALLDPSELMLEDKRHIEEMQQHIKDMRAQVEEACELAKAARGAWPPRTEEEEEELKEHFKAMEDKAQRLEIQVQNQKIPFFSPEPMNTSVENQSLEHSNTLLEKDRIHSEMKLSLNTYESKDDSGFKDQSDDMFHQTIKLQHQIDETELKLKKTKELIKRQDKFLKETRLGEEMGDYSEMVSTLRSEIQLRDEDNDKLKKKLHELRLHTRREQQLIISVWHDAARKTHRDLVNSKLYSSPWYGEQRQRRRPETQFIRL